MAKKQGSDLSREGWRGRIREVEAKGEGRRAGRGIRERRNKWKGGEWFGTEGGRGDGASELIP